MRSPKTCEAGTKPRMHPWPAPSVPQFKQPTCRGRRSRLRPYRDDRAERRGRQSRTAPAAAQPVRQHGRCVAPNERAGGLRLLGNGPDVGVSWSIRGHLRDQRAHERAGPETALLANARGIDAGWPRAAKPGSVHESPAGAAGAPQTLEADGPRAIRLA